MFFFAIALLLSLDGSAASGLPAAIDRFGGKSVPLAATFLAEPGTPIRATLFLDGGALQAPFAEPVEIVPAAGADPRLLTGTFDLALPSVKKNTAFRVVFSAPGDAGGPPEPCGEVRLTVWPRAFFAEGLPGGEALPEVAIAGRFPGLRELLDGRGIRHRDLDLEIPDSLPPGTVIVAEIGESAMPGFLLAASSKLVFAPRLTGGALAEVLPSGIILRDSPPADFRESPVAQACLRRLLLTP